MVLLAFLAAVFALARPEWLVSDDDSGGASLSTPTDAPDPTVVRDESSVSERAEPLAAPPSSLASPAAPAWRGRIVNAAGQPLTKAHVLRLPYTKEVSWTSHGPSPEDRTLLKRAASCESLASGEFTLPWDPPPEGSTWVLLVRHPEAMSRLLDCAGPLERGGDCGTLQLTPGCVARGRVLCADGSPAAGADVDGEIAPYMTQLFDGDTRYIVGLRDGLLHTTTDTDGRFELSGLPAASLGLEVQHVGHTPKQAGRFALTLEATWEIGDLRMERGGIVSGRVLDPAGRPLPGAEVRALGVDLEYLTRFEHGVHLVLEQARDGGWDRRNRPEARACVATTDAEGRFEIAGLRRALCGVVAAADGYEPVALDGVSVGSADIVLRLQDLGTLRLRLVDAVDRRALADAELRVQRLWTAGASASDLAPDLAIERAAPGEFVVRGVCSAPLVAIVRTPAAGLIGLYLPGLDPSARDETRELAVPRPISISGRVVDSSGAPLSTARIRFAPYSSDNQPLGFDWNEAGVDSDGHFRLGPMPADDWVVIAHAEERARSEHRRKLSPGEMVDLGDFVLPRMASVEALVLGAQGEPLAGVRMDAVPADRPLGGATVLASKSTDANGRARLLVEPGAVRIRSRKPPLAADLGTLAEAELRSVVLQQQIPLRLSGTVRSGGEPVPAAPIYFTHAFGMVNTKTDDGGRFQLEAPAGLGGTLWARSPRGGIASRLVEASADSALVVDLSFGTQRLRGRVLQHSTGAGLPGAAVQAWTEEPRLVGATVKVGDDGSFELSDMIEGRWVVQAFGDGLSFSEERPVTLPEEATSEVVLQVEKLGFVSGFLWTASGAAPPEHRVLLYLLPKDAEDRPEYASASADGRFAFKAVEPGDYELIATRGSIGHERPWNDRETVEELAWLRIPVRVAPGESAQQDVILPPGRP